MLSTIGVHSSLRRAGVRFAEVQSVSQPARVEDKSNNNDCVGGGIFKFPFHY